MNKFLEKLTWSDTFDFLLICGIVFLSYHGKDGWGWLVFILILKHS